MPSPAGLPGGYNSLSRSLVDFVSPAILCVYRLSRAYLHCRWIMKVRASVRRMCEKCKLIKRKGVVRIICEDPRHKQRQG